MQKFKTTLVKIIFVSLFLATSCEHTKKGENTAAEKHNVKTIKPIRAKSPEDAITELKNGNSRFINNHLVNTDFKQSIEETKGGQYPHSVILSCMDSRVPPEIIFDQGIGNVFSIRVAGNVEDENILGSLEYAVEHAGAKLIVVMGHNHCGAVTGAIKGIKLGYLTQLVDQIKPAMTTDSTKTNFIDDTARNNVLKTKQDIVGRSTIIAEMVREKKIKIVGAFYDIETGVVAFMD